MTTDQTLVNATITRLTGERDRARDAAAVLEAQTAAVAALHQPIPCHGCTTGHDSCGTCLVDYPCPTVQALGLGEDRTA